MKQVNTRDESVNLLTIILGKNFWQAFEVGNEMS